MGIMKTPLIAIAVFAVAAAFMLFPSSPQAHAQAEEKEPNWAGQKWEYKVLRIDDSRPAEAGRRTSSRDGGAEEKLNELGKQGWELVSIRIDAAAARTAPIFYFKRPANQAK